jgi:type IV secretion system protein TrbL
VSWGPCSIPGIHSVCGAVGGATKAVAGSAFQAVVDAFAKALAQVMKALMTFWINVPEPNLASSSVAIHTIDELTKPLVAFGAVIGLLVAGARMAWTARYEQAGQGIMRGLLLMVVVTAAGASIVELLLTGFDALAVHILNAGFDGKSVGERLTALGSLPGAGGGLVFILAFFGILSSLVQVVIMLLRGAILAVLVGILPVAAGASITEAGFGWFKRLVGWIMSFCLYKLTAAIIYATAFALIGSGKDLAGIVSGFGLIIIAILSLPALLRLLPPTAEAMGGSSGGALAGAVSAGATGAVALSSRGSTAPPATAAPGLRGSSGSDGSSGGGPTGANGTSGASGGPPALASVGGGGKGPGGSGGESGPGAAGGSAGRGASPPAAGGSSAGGGAAAAAGPAGALVGAGAAVHSAVKSASDGAVGDGGSQ